MGTSGSGGALSITSFDVLNKLGEGGFGTVLLVRKKDTGKLYALKVNTPRERPHHTLHPTATAAAAAAAAAAATVAHHHHRPVAHPRHRCSSKRT